MKSKHLFFFIAIFGTFPALAKTRVVPFDQIQWVTSSGVDFCEVKVTDELTHVEAKFRVKAGKPMQLYVKQPTKQWFGDVIQAHSVAPAWAWPDKSYVTTSATMVDSAQDPAVIEAELGGADVLLNDLINGNWLNISGLDRKIYFPTVNFNTVVQEYYACEKKLPPVSFESVRRVALQYSSGRITLTNQQQRRIKDMSTLIQADPSIKKILIDGHTDGVGDSITNLRVSRRRAEEVANRFHLNGISKKMIQVKGHGDRYPLASSKTEAGQNKNRRVEIRLVRK